MSSISDFLIDNNLSTELNKSGEIASDKSSALDKDAFLNLLVTQLKYQDPTNPVEDKDFLAQMAQFTTLEQMQNMNQTLTQFSTYSLVGKIGVLESYDETTGETSVIEGRVEGVSMKSGEAYVTINNTEYLASSISNVYEDYTEMGFIKNIQDALLTSENVNLVGKTIQAIIVDLDGNSTDFIEGVVDYVKFENGNAILSVNNNDIYAGEVLSISDDNMIIGKDINIKLYDQDTDSFNYSSGKVQEIVFQDNNAYAVINLEDGTQEQVKVNYINHITEALNYVGDTINFDNETLVIDNVTLYDGDVYLVSGDKEISYSDFRKSL